jgi:hypothetical protein
MAVIRFARLDGYGEDSVELDTCRRFLIGRPLGGPGLSPVDESTLHVYYLTPDYRWFQGIGGLRQIQRGGDGYLEWHPVMVAKTFLLFDRSLPPELEPFRHDATEGYQAWLNTQGPGTPGSKDARDGTLDARRRALQESVSERIGAGDDLASPLIDAAKLHYPDHTDFRIARNGDVHSQNAKGQLTVTPAKAARQWAGLPDPDDPGATFGLLRGLVTHIALFVRLNEDHELRQRLGNLADRAPCLPQHGHRNSDAIWSEFARLQTKLTGLSGFDALYDYLRKRDKSFTPDVMDWLAEELARKLCGQRDPHTLTLKEVYKALSDPEECLDDDSSGKRRPDAAKSSEQNASAQDATFDDLPPSRRKAYGQWNWAIETNAEFGKDTIDKHIYDWLTEHVDEDDPLPAFSAWSAYVREARRALGTQKHKPRLGGTTRSVKRRSDLG